MEKLFSVSHALVFLRDAIDTSTLGDKNPTFNRTALIVHAHVGVNVDDILSEVQDIEDRIEKEDRNTVGLQSTILTTTFSEYDDMVVALTYSAFYNLAINNYQGFLLRERYRKFAEELVYLRDERLKT